MDATMQTIDLHGYTIEDGVEATIKFIDSSFIGRHSSIEIITGNGPMFYRVLEEARKSTLVKEVRNDGILGFSYVGRVVLDLEDY